MRNKEVERGNKESHIEKKKVKLFLVRSRGYILKTFNYGLKGGAFISQLLPLLNKTEGCPMGKVQGCLPCTFRLHTCDTCSPCRHPTGSSAGSEKCIWCKLEMRHVG